MALEAVPMPVSHANAWIDAIHRHHQPKTGGVFFAVGAGWRWDDPDEGEIVGVALVATPTARMLHDGWTAEVARTAVVHDAPNANSFLYGACWRAVLAMGYRRLITYILESETGSSLRGAGWNKTADVKGASWDRPSRRRRIVSPYQLVDKERWEKVHKSYSSVVPYDRSYYPPSRTKDAQARADTHRRLNHPDIETTASGSCCRGNGYGLL